MRRLVALALALSILSCESFAESPKISIGGFGLFGNAALRNSLRLLEFESKQLETRSINDGAFLLLNRLTQNGYLDAQISADYELPNGEVGHAEWAAPYEPQIKDEIVATKLHYEVDAGQLYYYDEVTISGLVTIETENALNYILPNNALYSRKKDIAYSPSILNGHQKQLTNALNALGRIDAKVTATSVEIDTATGGVDVALLVDEGPLYKVVQTEVVFEESEQGTKPIIRNVDEVYSRRWVEDQLSALRNEYYHLGYPDTKVSSRIVESIPDGETVAVKMHFEVRHGPKIILSDVEYIGATDTHTPLLKRKSDLTVEEPLDITEVEAARRRLSGLGIFSRIDLEFEEDGPGHRKAIFDFENGNRIKAQLLLGYGSYESLRAGVIASRKNVFGRPQTVSFEAIQSVKSTSGKLAYSVPEILGESVNGSVEANYLDREELYFDRRERGVLLGLSKRIPKYKLDVGVDYAFDRKETSEPTEGEDPTDENTNIGSISVGATRSTVNNILYPTSGYDVSVALRYASEALGGEKNFIRPELSGGYHTQLGKRWILHLATKAGYISSPGENKVEIPKGELFLMGGENSLRGYRRGEAGPIGDGGNPDGVQAFVLFNIELEYPIFDKLNVVLFSDTARSWRSTGYIDEYEDLSDVGIGFRYNTIIGPVRLEYGHNLNPRPDDPSGTLHLSVGFPF